jgi:hypothetical protein
VLGNVLGEPGGLAPAAADDRERSVANPAYGAVWANDAVLCRYRLATRLDQLVGDPPRAVVGVDRREERVEVVEKRADRAPPHPLVREAEIEQPVRVEVGDVENLVDRLGQRPAARLALAQLRLRTRALYRVLGAFRDLLGKSDLGR